MKTYNLISILPNIFDSFLSYGVIGRAYKNKLFQTNFYNPRNYTTDLHKTVDDRPYGGAAGMVMLYEPLAKAIDDVKAKDSKTRVIYLSAMGEPLTQKKLSALNNYESLTFLCGRYEGIDQRLIDHKIDEQISIGDYVLSGGELASMCILDGLIRLQPGVLGNESSLLDDSFMPDESGEVLLGIPVYSKPQEIDGFKVPEVLLSGNHEKIATWKQQVRKEITNKLRPDLT